MTTGKNAFPHQALNRVNITDNIVSPNKWEKLREYYYSNSQRRKLCHISSSAHAKNCTCLHIQREKGNTKSSLQDEVSSSKETEGGGFILIANIDVSTCKICFQ